MNTVNTAVQSLVALVGVWHPSDVPRTPSYYYNSAQFRNWKAKARKIISENLDIPSVVRHELRTFESPFLEDIISQYAIATENMTDEQEKIATDGKEDMSAAIMAEYMMLAYSAHLESRHGAATLHSCIDDVTASLPVSYTL